MQPSHSPPPDPSEFLDDPRRQPLEIDTQQRRGPAVFRWLTIGMEHLIAALLVALIVSVSANVIGRALLNHSLPWADELARMLFIWL
ncbi:TRAP transporter small permease, partial [Halomonas salipaludis]